MTPRRLLPRLIALVLAVAGLSGCVAIKTESSGTRLPGAVTLSVSICASHRVAGSPCIPNPVDASLSPNTAEADNGSDALSDTGGLAGQLLVGFRLPDGTVAPDRFTSPDGEAFTQSPSYAADLTADRAAPAGFHWVGYISSSVTPTAGASLTSFSIELGLPAGAGGAPFIGPFRWRAIAGFRPVNGNASDPVFCGQGSDCYDSPPAGELFTDLNQAVSDFRVLPGSGATAAPGQAATVSFPVRFADGAAFGPQTLALSAASGLPGSPSPSVPRSLAIAPGATPAVSATVTVPPGTAPGTYPVTLTAADGATNPVTRANTATITVVDRTAPAITIGSPTDGEQLTVGQRIAADYRCADEANGSGLASCAGPVAPGAPIDTASAGTKTFTVTATDHAGNAATLTRTYTVVAPPRPTVNASVTFAFAGTRTGLRFTSLVVKDVPKGATVTARCAHGHCQVRRFAKRNAPRTVVLKPFLHRTLRRGTVVTVSVTKSGAIGRIRTLTIARKAVKVATTCLPPGAKKPGRCAT